MLQHRYEPKVFNDLFKNYTLFNVALCGRQFRTYTVKAGREGSALPIVLCDTMGLEDVCGAGLDLDDVSSIIKGHIPDRYKVRT